MIQIYDINNAELIQVNPADSTYRNKVIMSENILMLYFSLTEAVEIPIGAYVMYKGERYTLYSQENFTMTHTRKYDYTLMLETEEAFLKSTKLKYFVIVDGLPQRPFSLKFVLVLTPSEWIELIVNNLNLTEPGWSVGDCLDAEARQIAFNHEYCDGALNRIAEEYNTEYEIVNKTISLKKVEKFKDNPLPLAYGKQNGLKSGITRTKESEKLPVGILYVQGGEKNIDFSKYHSRTLLLPKSQSLVYEGRTYITDADGTMITCVDLPENKNEDSYDASSISPQRVGSVTQVIAVDAEAHFYDIIDSTIPQSLDFSQMRIAGEKAVLIFQSGSLSGYSFDIQQTEENLDGYVHAERRFKLVPLDQDGMILPSGGMIPEVGDTYAVFNIALPDAYVCDNVTKTGASWDMFREAVRYKYENEIPRSIYKGELDEIYAKSNWLAIGGKIVPGGYVLFSHPQFLPDGQKIRIVGVKEFINKPYSPKIELSNVVSGGSVKNDIAKIDASEVVNDSLHKQSLQFTKRRFRDAQETMTLLSQSLLNFSGSVSPITVQTMALLVGDESLQFRFVNSKTVPVAANHVIEFNNATKVLSAAPGILQHMTVGIKTISQSHLASEYRYWDMAAYDSPPLTEANASKAYYLYAKCANPGTAGVFVLSDVAIGMTSVAGYYHFLVGILNSENASERSYVSLYGFSEILPGRITTDKIVSPDGRLSIDLSSNPPKITALDGAIIEGKVQFQAGSSGLAQLAEWPTAAQDIQDAAAAAAEAERKAVEAQEKLANDIDPKLAKMQEQIDGEVSNYYLPYSPTLANYPASEWLTTIEKEAHLGDTFNNNLQFISDIETPDAGKFWRWTKSGTDYFWNQISDSDSVLALKKAAEAKGVADGKSTHYLIQPSAYKFGDSWVCDIVGDAEKGSMLFATQDSNVFNRAHWVKKDKYTDDTAVINLKIGGRNLFRNGDYSNGLDHVGQIFGDGTIREVVTDSTFGHALRVTSNIRLGQLVNVGLLAGTPVTISFYAKATSATAITLSGIGFDTGVPAGILTNSSEYFYLLTTWKHYSYTFIAAADLLDNENVYFYLPGGDVDPIYFTRVKIEVGNKATDWTAAYEDVYADATAKAAAAQATAEAYALAKANLAEVTAKSYADGIVTEEEVRAIADATAKANAAQSAAVAAAAADATAKANAAQTAAQEYAVTKANLAEAVSKAYADGIVTEEEIRAIADATAKANAAEAAAISAAALDATAKSVAAQSAAEVYALAKANLAEITAKSYADGVVTEEETRAIADATAKANAAQAAAIAAAALDATSKVGAVRVGGRNLIKGSDYITNIEVWTYPLSVQAEGSIKFVRYGYGWAFAQNIPLEAGIYTWSGLFRATSDNAIARASYSNGEIYLGGIGTNWSYKSITFEVAVNSSGFNFLEANAAGVLIDFALMKIEKGNKATDWSPAYEDVYADATAKAAAAQATAEAYALAKANLAEVTAKSYADGIVTEEEVRAIADATAKANAAQSAAVAAAAADAANRVNSIHVGGRNLFRNGDYSNGMFNVGALFGNGTIREVVVDPQFGHALKTSANIRLGQLVNVGLLAGTPVTISFYAKAATNTGITLVGVGYDSGSPLGLCNFNRYFNITTSWQRFSATAIAVADLLDNENVYFYLPDTDDCPVYFTRVQVEVGNMATEWTAALEDVQSEIDAAKAKALELEYLKTALTGTTEVAGGLILARMMMLKNALNQVTAGISGMDSNDIFLFANDTDALNAALNNMATFLLRRNGTGNLGTLKFTRNGLAYCTRNADGTLGKAIIEFRNTPIPPLSDLVASFTDTKAAPGGNATKMGGVLTGNFGYGVPIVVSEYDNFSMRITGTLEASINNVGDMPILDSHAAINLVLYKYDGGVYTVEQNVASMYLLRDVTGTDSDSIAVDETYTLAKGTYYLRAEYYINTSEGSHDSGFVSAANLQMVASGASGNQTMIFGSNGFVRVKDGNNFTYMSDEMMAHRGVSDMPGVLASASVASTGSSSRQWGAKVSDSSKPSTGTYQINHTIGHTDYTIQITPNTAGRLAYISARYSTYCTVVLTNTSSTATDTAFDYIIMGMN